MGQLKFITPDAQLSPQLSPPVHTQPVCVCASLWTPWFGSCVVAWGSDASLLGFVSRARCASARVCTPTPLHRGSTSHLLPSSPQTHTRCVVAGAPAGQMWPGSSTLDGCHNTRKRTRTLNPDPLARSRRVCVCLVRGGGNSLPRHHPPFAGGGPRPPRSLTFSLSVSAFEPRRSRVCRAKRDVVPKSSRCEVFRGTTGLSKSGCTVKRWLPAPHGHVSGYVPALMRCAVCASLVMSRGSRWGVVFLVPNTCADGGLCFLWGNAPRCNTTRCGPDFGECVHLVACQ